MRARRVGKGSEFRLIQNEREIGSVGGNAVRFHGFADRSDAAAAASLAYRALSRRRKAAARRTREPSDVVILSHDSADFIVARSGILARLLRPSPEIPQSGWGFEVELLPEEGFEVFAVARARVMWRALQGTILRRRMLQFQGSIEHPATSREH